MVPHTEGLLYRNFKGIWYPVCNDPMDWAKEACETELAELKEYDLHRSMLINEFCKFLFFILILEIHK